MIPGRDYSDTLGDGAQNGKMLSGHLGIGGNPVNTMPNRKWVRFESCPVFLLFLGLPSSELS